jgi:hypothetical protein
MNTISLDGCQYPAASSLPLNLSLLQEVIAAIPDLIYIADLVNDCNVYVNHRMTEILAYTEADVQAIDCAGRAAQISDTLTEEAAEVQTVMNEYAVPLLGFYSGVEVAPMLGQSRGLDWTGVLLVLAEEQGEQ